MKTMQIVSASCWLLLAMAACGAGQLRSDGSVGKAAGDAAPTADEHQAAAALERAGHIVERSDRQIPTGLTVRARGKPLPDQTMSQVHKLVHLEKIFLCNVLPADLDLANLKSHPHLNNLGIGYSREKLSDEDMAHIGGLTGLRRLNVMVPVSDAAVAHLAKLTDLDNLTLARSTITDAALVHIARCAKLKSLGLGETKITDAELAQLQGLKSLEKLFLGGTVVGDRGAEKLAVLSGLQELSLAGTQVTDAGLEHLNALTRLQKLDLTKTKVTDAGVERFQKALPNCRIVR